MSIIEIRGKKVNMDAWVAEATVEDDNGEELYVTVHYYDGETYTVSDQSVYDFMTDDCDEPAADFLEEYDDCDEAAKSDFADVFEILQDLLDKLD